MPGSTAAGRSIRPGAVTQLLADLIRAPRGAGWDVPLLPGDHVGRFEILQEIGRGGFGVVYEARDSELGRSVAFKAVRADHDALADARRLGEADAAARLAHPNIVHLYDVGRCDQGAFLIMELLRGRPLSDWLGSPVPLRDAVRVGVEVSGGLAHAHAAGVVHRDLKPANVFVCDDGQVKVLDFGLAHVFGRAAVEGGTPAYMAPEQARGEIGDERSDLFSLGVILQELLTGTRIRRGPPATEDEARVTAREPPPTARQRIPGSLSRLVAQLTAADPAQRPASAVEVHELLASAQKALEPKRAVWVASALAAAAVVGAGVFTWAWQRPLPPGRLVTAIADTANATGDADLEAVSELLRTGLEQSRRLSLITRSRLVNALREAGDPQPRAMGEKEARRAAQRAQVQLLLVPAVQTAETGYRISLTGIDLARGETQFTVSEPVAAKSTIPVALQRLVQSVRRRLKEDPTTVVQAGTASVADVASANPEALRFYAEGRRLASEGRFKEAIAAHKRALEADPEFLLPRVAILEHKEVGDVGTQLEEQRDLAKNKDVLRRNLQRLSGSDAAWVETAMVDAPSDRERLRMLERVMEAWPDDPRAFLQAAMILLFAKVDVATARPYMEKAIANAPVQQVLAIEFLLYLHRFDEALARAQAMVQATPLLRSFNWLAEVHRQRGEVALALDAARRGAALAGTDDAMRTEAYDGREPRAVEVYIDADALEEFEKLEGPDVERDRRWLRHRGRLREALATQERDRPAPGASFGQRTGFHYQRLITLLATGDVEAVWREIEALLRLGWAPQPFFSWILAEMGDAERAEFLVMGMDERHVCADMTRAVAAWKRGERDAALAILAPYTIAVADLYRGRILAEEGHDRDAVEAFRRYRLHRGVSLWEANLAWWFYPQSLYLEAEALERLGDRDEARALVKRLLHLWERADPDLPLLTRAKALAARLDEGGR